MTQFQGSVRRSGGEVDVYTGLLFAAFAVLLVGVILLATRNIEHSASGTTPGGMFKLVQKSGR